jgi:hypothetical protein
VIWQEPDVASMGVSQLVRDVTLLSLLLPGDVPQEDGGLPDCESLGVPVESEQFLLVNDFHQSLFPVVSPGFPKSVQSGRVVGCPPEQSPGPIRSKVHLWSWGQEPESGRVVGVGFFHGHEPLSPLGQVGRVVAHPLPLVNWAFAVLAAMLTKIPTTKRAAQNARTRAVFTGPPVVKNGLAGDVAGDCAPRRPSICIFSSADCTIHPRG